MYLGMGDILSNFFLLSSFYVKPTKKKEEVLEKQDDMKRDKNIHNGQRKPGKTNDASIINKERELSTMNGLGRGHRA